jgi:hypothetical protein
MTENLMHETITATVRPCHLKQHSRALEMTKPGFLARASPGFKVDEHHDGANYTLINSDVPLCNSALKMM